MKKLNYFIIGLLCMVVKTIVAQQVVQSTVYEKFLTSSKVEVIVMMKEQANVAFAKKIVGKQNKAKFVFEQLNNTALNTQMNVINTIRQFNEKPQPYYLVNAVIVNATKELVEALAKLPEVKSISYNQPIKMELPRVENIQQGGVRGPAAIEWGISMMKADSVWQMGITGAGATVAGEDTGYDWTHPTLKNKYRGWDVATSTEQHNYNWYDAIHAPSPLSADSLNPCGFNSPVPCDDNSHGTHTMGTMIGDDGVGNQIGVAPGANWISCRNMERGNGSPMTYIECFEFFLAPTDLQGENPNPALAPDVINNSWYCSTGEGCNEGNFDIMRIAIANLKAAGIVVVVSNGNFGGPCLTTNNPPAFFGESFSIGATTAMDSIAGFSSRGPVTIDGSNRIKPDVSAPGQDVRSCTPNGGFANYSGTSMAGPHAAGVVALIVSSNPLIAGEVETIEEILRLTAVSRTSSDSCGNVPGWEVPNNTYGHGRIDALAAVKMAMEYEPNAIATPDFSDEAIVYPNPFGSFINIELNNGNWSDDIHFKLFDSAGKVLVENNWKATNGSDFNRIYLPQTLTAGIYYYQIIGKNKQANGKLVKL